MGWHFTEERLQKRGTQKKEPEEIIEWGKGAEFRQSEMETEKRKRMEGRKNVIHIKTQLFS